jgi:uncharacterized membrane-anchored protein YitT (DUF2179 family)
MFLTVLPLNPLDVLKMQRTSSSVEHNHIPLATESRAIMHTDLPPLTSPHGVAGEPAFAILSNIFQFDDLGNATACSSFTFSWKFIGEHVTSMTLFIVGEQRPTSIVQPPLRILAQGVLSNSQKFTWTIVDVEEGWYRVNAVETVPMIGLPMQMTTFFVKNSSDLSCLPSSPPTIQAAFHKSSNSASRPHIQPRHIGPSELVGIVFGGLAGAVLLALAFMFPRLWRRALPSRKKRRIYILY